MENSTAMEVSTTNGTQQPISFQQVKQILTWLQQHEHSYPFLRPVDPVKDNLPDYFQIIKEPVDLQTIQQRIETNSYKSSNEAVSDIRLVWKNAKTYNNENSGVYQFANELSKEFERLLQRAVEKAKAETNAPASRSNSKVDSNASLKDKVSAICDSLENMKDATGRYVADLFIELPSSEEYPNYYQLIKKPISISMIRKKNYHSIQEVISDFNQLVVNAQTFNSPESLVFEDSKRLLAVFNDKISRLFPNLSPLPSPQSLISLSNVSIPSRPVHSHSTGQNGKALDEEDWEEDGEENVEEDDDTIEGERKRPFEDSNHLEGVESLPLRNPKRRKAMNQVYVEKDDDLEDEEEGDEEDIIYYQQSEKEQRDPTTLIEKILGVRKKGEGSEPASFEYYIKWKNRSYLHAEWFPYSHFENDSTNKGKITRFWQQRRQKERQGIIFDDEKEEYFSTDYLEVERIIARQEQEIDGEKKILYLVKWKSLNYDEATWETSDDVKEDQKISEFLQWDKFPTNLTLTPLQMFTKVEEWNNFKDEHRLRSYQMEGMNWLAFCWVEKRGCILADEMGLGKTIQSIAFLDYISTIENNRGPFLVVAPLSTMGHWQREFEEWTHFNTVVYQGNSANRELIRNHEFFFKDENGQVVSRDVYKFNVLLTTYEMILSPDWEELQQVPWQIIVTDEAQRLKNQTSKLLGRLKQFSALHRVLLTGTPLQNNTQELWSLLNFIEEKKFSSLKDFLTEFGQLENSEQVSRLHAVLRPHLLRRMKEDVEKSIPPKEETLVEVELTSIQKQYYRAILERNREFLNRGCVNKNVPNLMNIVMQLRKVCNHPFLIPGVEEKATADKSNDEYYRLFIQSSGKLVLLDKLLPKLREGGHKVLIFSQMMRVLDLLETYLRYKNYLYERLDGGVRGNERQAAIDRFCRPNSDRFVFLLCTRAGGVGINLTSADTVIIYDSDWNPQNDIQAQARCHRIGQTQEVKVYRLITTKTYERRMFEKSSKKLGLDHVVLSDMGSPVSTGLPSKGSSTLDKKEIDELLKFGAYDIFNDDDTSDAFGEEDIDQILNRSSKVVWNESNAKVLGGSSSFAKASFYSSTVDREIDLDDPDFWEKILPEAKTAERLLQRLEQGECTSTPEQREEFLLDLGELVDEVTDAFREGKPELVSLARSTLLRIFDEVKDKYLLEFSESQQETLIAWIEEVFKPRRSRKAISRFSSGTFGRDRSQRARNIDTIERTWTDRERRKFHSAFMSFGPGRWEDIQKQADLESKSIDEIREYGQEFAKQCVIASEDADRSVFLEALDAILVPDTEELEVELKEDYMRFMRRKLKMWARQLRMILFLNEIIAEDPEAFDVPKVNRPLASWWGRKEDRSLLMGVWKHGFGNYDEIRKDSELSFVLHAKAIEEAEALEREKEEKEKEEKEGKEGKEDKEEKEEKDDKDEKDEKDDDDEEDEMDVEDEKEAAPIYDEKSSVLKIPKLKISLQLPSGWPSSKTLDAHVKYLVEVMGKNTATSTSKDRHKLLRFFEKQTRKRVRGDRLKDWTKRELNDFRMALMTYGAGNWELIREKAGLHKNSVQIEEQYEVLVEQSRQLVDIRPQRRVEKKEEPEKPKEEVKEEKGKEEKMEVEPKEESETTKDADVKMEESDEKTEEVKKEEKEEKKEEVSTPNMLVTPSMARKLLKRLKLMNDVKAALKHPKFAERLAKIPSDMPQWWYPPVHDKALLELVLQLGIGTKEWETFLEDPDGPFYRDAEGKVDFRKQKQKFMINFCREKPFLNRLEFIRLVVLDPAASAELDRRGSDFFFTRSYRERRRRGEEDPDPLPLDVASPKVKLNLNFKVSTRDVPRDDEGNVILPITAKGATIHSLGTVVFDRPAFYSKNYIWPVGYKSSRRLPSMKNQKEYVMYTSEILDGGNGPLFQVTPSDNPQVVLQHNTSSGVWCETLKLIKKKPNVSVSGPEMFGFSDPTVKMLIQELPNAKKCTNYLWKDFGSTSYDFPSSPTESKEKKA